MENFTGELTQDTNNGRIVIRYVSGKKQGTTKFIDKFTGLVLSEIEYRDDVIDGKIKQFYQSGAILSVVTYKGGILDGPFVSYYENGMKQMESFYVNGKQDGTTITYDEFGDTVAESHYRQGMKHGQNTVYYPKSLGGGVFELSSFENGKLTGNRVTFYDTGEPMSVTPYIAGRAQQYPKNYSKNGEELRPYKLG
ncbi:MAG: toxin-antitoxin system YwqK family antitoxin [Holosporales bacterium]|nr:toxin-antitoxin system YwqK family antitoxin [Holosporales bacterium]